MEEERSILVNIPDNLQIKNIIDSVARFVATEGIEFEKVDYIIFDALDFFDDSIISRHRSSQKRKNESEI